ncbi:TonB-dependent receptor plug domain-containing protein [Leptobacterium flavescens]|uniref:TonB-dependent receptor plug domain-containing protein n=1 Tax=Leptobacterium flavescens TaxID=472055 RepID=A0A6P0UQ18_9FLAO|nr:carboxypeptidase-like regulatory domain-containing protein [Leptobacterium flavescens]NER15235.1 TonB-dependent receptor plug domain-containing protein [Leptobacterium flavescens]
MNSLRLKTLFFIFTWLTSSSILSQTKSEKIALRDVLQKIEQQFDVKFSYQDADINDVLVTNREQFGSLKQALNFLRKESSLDYRILDKRFIAISRVTILREVCGSIKDFNTNSGLEGASIEVIGTSLRTISDQNASFSFKEVPLDAQLRIKFLGYETINVPARRFAEREGCPIIFMISEIQRLDEVVLVNYLTQGINKEVDGTVAVYPQNFGILPGLSDPDILQTIQALPGVESIDETISNINIRGGTHDQNLILWDGIKMYHTGHFFGLISAFNPYLTEKIDVIKNGTSARFNDGVSSTIDIRTKNEVTSSFSGGAGFNLISADFYTQIPIAEKWSAQLSARRSVTDFLNTPTFNQYFERSFQDTEITEQGVNVDREVTGNENFFFHDYAAKLLFDASDKDELRLSFINVRNELSYEEFGLEEEDTRTSTLEQQNIALGGHWDRKWNENFTTSVFGYFTRYNIDAVNFDIRSGQRLEQNNEVLETGFKVHAELKLGDFLLLNSGYQFYEVGITNAVDINLPRFFETDKDVLDNHAFFTELSWKRNRTYIRGGVRLNYAEKFNRFIVEPRLNINHKLNNSLSANLQGEFKSQFTSQIIDLQEDFLGIDTRRWVLADENLIPIITSKQGAIGLDYNYKGWYISTNAFYKQVEGITTRSQGFLDQNQFQNAVGEYRVKGIEFLVNKQNNRFSTWFSYTLGKNDYTFETLVPSSFPNNADIRHSLSLAGTYTIRNLKLAVGFKWRSGRPFTLPDRDDPVNEGVVPSVINYEAPNAENLDDFLRTDISAIYDFQLSEDVQATLSASVLNVLDKENTINTYFRLTDTDERVQRVNSQSLGITPNLSFRIRF